MFADAIERYCIDNTYSLRYSWTQYLPDAELDDFWKPLRDEISLHLSFIRIVECDRGPLRRISDARVVPLEFRHKGLPLLQRDFFLSSKYDEVEKAVANLQKLGLPTLSKEEMLEYVKSDLALPARALILPTSGFGLSPSPSGNRARSASPSAGIFGTPSSSSSTTTQLFGRNSSSKAPSAFGQGFPSSGGGLFGGNSSSKDANPFGQNSSSSNTLTPLFGSNPSVKAPSLFGQSAPSIGSSLFGSNSSSKATGPFTQSSSSSGGSLFGTNNASSTSGGGLFGSTSLLSTYGGMFGSATTATSGPSVNSFGNTPPLSTGSIFGWNTTTTSGPSGGLFGHSTSSSTNENPFGGCAATGSSGGRFGTTPPTQSAFGTANFGSPNTPLNAGLSTSRAHSPAASTGSLFGAGAGPQYGSRASTPSTGFGSSSGPVAPSGFNGLGSSSGGLFGSATTSSGAGSRTPTSSLFGNRTEPDINDTGRSAGPTFGTAFGTNIAPVQAEQSIIKSTDLSDPWHSRFLEFLLNSIWPDEKMRAELRKLKLLPVSRIDGISWEEPPAGVFSPRIYFPRIAKQHNAPIIDPEIGLLIIHPDAYAQLTRRDFYERCGIVYVDPHVIVQEVVQKNRAGSLVGSPRQPLNYVKDFAILFWHWGSSEISVNHSRDPLWAADNRAHDGFSLSGRVGPSRSNGTVDTPFKALLEKDPGGATSSNYQSNTFQPQHQNSSFEELRIEDYAQGRRYSDVDRMRSHRLYFRCDQDYSTDQLLEGKIDHPDFGFLHQDYFGSEYVKSSVARHVNESRQTWEDWLIKVAGVRTYPELQSFGFDGISPVFQEMAAKAPGKIVATIKAHWTEYKIDVAAYPSVLTGLKATLVRCRNGENHPLDQTILPTEATLSASRSFGVEHQMRFLHLDNESGPVTEQDWSFLQLFDVCMKPSVRFSLSALGCLTHRYTHGFGTSEWERSGQSLKSLKACATAIYDGIGSVANLSDRSQIQVYGLDIVQA